MKHGQKTSGICIQKSSLTYLGHDWATCFSSNRVNIAKSALKEMLLETTKRSVKCVPIFAVICAISSNCKEWSF